MQPAVAAGPGNYVYFVLNACLVVTNSLGLALAIHRRGVSGGVEGGPKNERHLINNAADSLNDAANDCTDQRKDNQPCTQTSFRAHAPFDGIDDYQTAECA